MKANAKIAAFMKITLAQTKSNRFDKNKKQTNFTERIAAKGQKKTRIRKETGRERNRKTNGRQEKGREATKVREREGEIR